MSTGSVLIIGGTGLISAACVSEAVSQGFKVTVLNRGQSVARPVPEGVEMLRADVRVVESLREALGGRTFDTVIDFIAFTPDHVATDLAVFDGRCAQYIFISSAAAYQTPPLRFPILESTPLRNPFWTYAQDKIACEDLLVTAWRHRAFPVTIVRPSHTYDRTQVPTMGGRTDLVRMQRGAPVVVHGDGTTIWTITHTSDFARAFTGVIGRPDLLGETFHITSDEAPTWDQIYSWLAAALGVKANLVHVAAETVARVLPQLGPGVLGDRMNCAVFDNSKIKSVVPGFYARMPFVRGAAEIVDWYLADEGRQMPDADLEAGFDRLSALARGA